jgi:hypothetical protein
MGVEQSGGGCLSTSSHVFRRIGFIASGLANGDDRLSKNLDSLDRTRGENYFSKYIFSLQFRN